MTGLLIEAEKAGIEVLEDARIGRLKGLYIDNIIVLNSNLETEKEKRCILCEELGHHFTSYGNILDQTKIENRKQERRARAWAYEKLISPDTIIKAYEHGVQNRFELAEFLNVTEEFVQDAISYYKTKYWPYYRKGEYCIIFDPLNVIKKEAI
ncbi:MAG TPA: ImmA/IrrE family metallo-endopeptidase [Thermoanaerobacterales bacterium]|nr:ImmA/IrrE family metallo-endopeptidase [Thermoanaerobacterales bacterium]